MSSILFINDLIFPQNLYTLYQYNIECDHSFYYYLLFKKQMLFYNMYKYVYRKTRKDIHIFLLFFSIVFYSHSWVIISRSLTQLYIYKHLIFLFKEIIIIYTIYIFILSIFSPLTIIFF